ncbi:hypothetical protein ACFFGV_13260 [Pontibacillus salicampi]|uniref:DUF3995 domain-containing protein n=1 Tax=Pontibacillus salicampi TaxID=1449801 RepID=A0ABV6LQL6_9BACI
MLEITITIISLSIMLLLALFHILLAFGAPLGEYAWGGFYPTLPRPFRIGSIFSALVLLFLSGVYAQNAGFITITPSLPTNTILIIVTVFFALNTFGNIASKSRKERWGMTPISSVLFLLTLALVFIG